MSFPKLQSRGKAEKAHNRTTLTHKSPGISSITTMQGRKSHRTQTFGKVMFCSGPGVSAGCIQAMKV